MNLARYIERMDDPSNFVTQLMRDLNVPTQHELAALMNVSPGTISRWRNASAAPQDRRIARSLLDLGLDPEKYGLRIPVGVTAAPVAGTMPATPSSDPYQLVDVQAHLALSERRHQEVMQALNELRLLLEDIDRRT